jgi:hypothetical protein
VCLSLEDQVAFVEAIATPPEPNDALRGARDANAELYEGSSFQPSVAFGPMTCSTVSSCGPPYYPLV